MPSQELEKVQQAIRQVGRTCDSLQAQMVQKLRIVIQKREELEAKVAGLEKRLAALEELANTHTHTPNLVIKKKEKK